MWVCIHPDPVWHNELMTWLGVLRLVFRNSYEKVSNTTYCCCSFRCCSHRHCCRLSEVSLWRQKLNIGSCHFDIYKMCLSNGYWHKRRSHMCLCMRAYNCDGDNNCMNERPTDRPTYRPYDDNNNCNPNERDKPIVIIKDLWHWW